MATDGLPGGAGDQGEPGISNLRQLLGLGTEGYFGTDERIILDIPSVPIQGLGVVRVDASFDCIALRRESGADFRIKVYVGGLMQSAVRSLITRGNDTHMNRSVDTPFVFNAPAGNQRIRLTIQRTMMQWYGSGGDGFTFLTPRLVITESDGNNLGVLTQQGSPVGFDSTTVEQRIWMRGESQPGVPPGGQEFEALPANWDDSPVNATVAESSWYSDRTVTYLSGGFFGATAWSTPVLWEHALDAGTLYCVDNSGDELWRLDRVTPLSSATRWDSP